MTRWVVLVLALLLPLQFAWAGAAAYCQHETKPSETRHFGHHEHKHEASAEKPGVTKLAADTDCGTCHAAGAPAMVDAHALSLSGVGTAAVCPRSSRPLPEALARAPDRPQWPRLA